MPIAIKKGEGRLKWGREGLMGQNYGANSSSLTLNEGGREGNLKKRIIYVANDPIFSGSHHLMIAI